MHGTHNRQGRPRPSARTSWSIVAVMLLTCICQTVQADLCRHWSQARNVGTLDPAIIREASGLAESRQFTDRLYHSNDSGDGPFFYLTDMQGKHTQRVRIAGFNALGADVEALSVGPCPPHISCLFVGNIGDNHRNRQAIAVFVIAEKQAYAESVVPEHQLTLHYPDGPHDAEGLAVHPNGDIYILTKEIDRQNRQALPAKIFRVPASQWQHQPAAPHIMTLVGEIDLPGLALFYAAPWGALATGFDIAPNGKTFLVLTYEHAWEFQVDLATQALKLAQPLKQGIDYRRIALTRLPQQEAIAYVSGRNSFLYSTESRGTPAQLMRVDCLD